MASFFALAKRGIGGLPPTSVFAERNERKRMKWLANTTLAQTILSLVIGEILLTNKEIMIATSVAIGAVVTWINPS